MNEIEDRRRRKEIIELVTFPASKHYPKEDKSKSAHSHGDPLEELLNEYSHLDDEITIETLLTEEQMLLTLGVDPEELDHLRQTDDESYSMAQLALLEDIALRLKYYLDEIESVLPNSR